MKTINLNKVLVLLSMLLTPSMMFAAGNYSCASEAFFCGAMQILFLYGAYALYKFIKKTFNNNNNK